MRPREFLPRSLLDLPADGDDDAIVGRGRNLRLEDRFRLRGSVGRGRPNEPGDVATVETLLRQTGDLDFRRDREPTGLFGVPLEEATRRFQRRNRLAADGIVNPEDETIKALERESFGREDAEERRREAACVQNRVRLDNLQIQIDQGTERLEAANATVVALSEEAESLDTRHALQLAITVTPLVLRQQS